MNKVTKGVFLIILSPIIAIVLLIGGIFSDGIDFNHNIVNSLYDGSPIALAGEKMEYVKEIQDGLVLIDQEMDNMEESFSGVSNFNRYQVKGYYIGLMFSNQHMRLDRSRASDWVRSYTTQTIQNEGTEEETVTISPTSVNAVIYSQLEDNLSMSLHDETIELMERVYGGLIGNSNGTVTTLSSEDIQKLLDQMPEGVSQVRKDLIIQAADAVGKIPYYWGGVASVPGYEGNDFGRLVSPDSAGRNRKGLDCSHFVDWVYWTVMGNNLGNTNTTGQIRMCEKISVDELLPGDLAFLIENGSTTHVGIYAGRNEKGELVWIHENAYDNNVAVNTVSYWSGYYRLNFMKGR